MSSLQLAVVTSILLLPMVLISAQLRSIAVMLRRILDEDEMEVVKEFPAPILRSPIARLSSSRTGFTVRGK